MSQPFFNPDQAPKPGGLIRELMDAFEAVNAAFTAFSHKGIDVLDAGGLIASDVQTLDFRHPLKAVIAGGQIVAVTANFDCGGEGGLVKGGSAVGEHLIKPGDTGAVQWPLSVNINPIAALIKPGKIFGEEILRLYFKEELPVDVLFAGPHYTFNLFIGEYDFVRVRLEAYGTGIILGKILEEKLGAHSTGYMTFCNGSSINDGNTLTISDGVVTKVFEFNKIGPVTPGHVPVPITGSMSEQQVCQNFINALNGAGFGVKAEFDNVWSAFLYNQVRKAANVPIISTVACPSFEYSGMEGGYNPASLLSRLIAFS